MVAPTEQIIRKFIEENFLFRTDQSQLADDESLLDAGLIDSTGILELVTFLEAQFGIHLADAEIVPENLDTIHAICKFIGRKLAPSTPNVG